MRLWLSKVRGGFAAINLLLFHGANQATPRAKSAFGLHQLGTAI
jgi:hypothetical protein